MSRSDAKQLSVPDFKEESKDVPKEASTDKPESQVGALLDSMGKKAILINRCKSCNGTLSAIEQKMGRCQTCGKPITDSDDTQGSTPSTPPQLQVRI